MAMTAERGQHSLNLKFSMCFQRAPSGAFFFASLQPLCA